MSGLINEALSPELTSDFEFDKIELKDTIGSDNDIENIFQVFPQSFAVQLTILDMKVFREIKIEELKSCAWNTKEKLIKTPNIVKMTRRFNHVNFWVQKEILAGVTPKQRAEKIGFFIQIMKHLVDLRSLHSCQAILSALQSAAIYRMNKSWILITKKERISFERLEELFKEEGNKSRLREFIRTNSHLPLIPYLGLYLTDIVYISVAFPSLYNKNHIHDDNKMNNSINCGNNNKINSPCTNNKMNNVLKEITYFQKSSFEKLVGDPGVQKYLNSVRFIEELHKFAEDDNFKLSLKLEPLESCLEDSNPPLSTGFTPPNTSKPPIFPPIALTTSSNPKTTPNNKYICTLNNEKSLSEKKYSKRNNSKLKSFCQNSLPRNFKRLNSFKNKNKSENNFNNNEESQIIVNENNSVFASNCEEIKNKKIRNLQNNEKYKRILSFRGVSRNSFNDIFITNNIHNNDSIENNFYQTDESNIWVKNEILNQKSKNEKATTQEFVHISKKKNNFDLDLKLNNRSFADVRELGENIGCISDESLKPVQISTLVKSPIIQISKTANLDLKKLSLDNSSPDGCKTHSKEFIFNKRSKEENFCDKTSRVLSDPKYLNSHLQELEMNSKVRPIFGKSSNVTNLIDDSFMDHNFPSTSSLNSFNNQKSPRSKLESPPVSEHETICVKEGVIKRKTIIKNNKKSTLSRWNKFWMALLKQHLMFFHQSSMVANERKHFKSDPCKILNLPEWNLLISSSPSSSSSSSSSSTPSSSSSSSTSSLHEGVFYLTHFSKGTTYKMKCGSRKEAEVWASRINLAKFNIKDINLMSFH